jgi:hypothetical protein
MKPSQKRGAGAAITLMVLAPLIAEVLSGATRFSSLFVFPIEVCVWGGGALLIREAVRKRRLGWIHMLLLALALSLAEELLIQQTSLAPLVIRIKGVTYARALGVNYVYLLWALIYEPVFVVFLPVYLSELLFPSRKQTPWLSRKGTWLVGVLFVLGACLAWYSWTQIARPRVFHMADYRPSVTALAAGAALIAALIIVALGPGKRWSGNRSALTAPQPGWVAAAGGIWAVLLEGLVILAFGLHPAFPPLAAVASGLVLALTPLTIVPRWAAGKGWTGRHLFFLVSGTLTGLMAAGYVAFIGSLSADLYFKIVVNVLSLVLLAVYFRNNRKALFTPLSS